MHISEIMKTAPVIPVLQIDDATVAVPMAEALVAGGLPVLEVTLRTPAALDATAAIAKHVPSAVVGVGTVTRPDEFDRARDAGARFIVSPGVSPGLLNAGVRTGMPFLPGAVTASEILMALDAGWKYLKFFPAEAAGGVRTLKAFAGPFPDVKFCPTGGLKPNNYLDYLNLPNVLCVGGTWLTPADLVTRGDWDAVTDLAARVSGARPTVHGDAAGGDQPESTVGEEDPGAATEDLVGNR
ncbi:MAG: bifunctional 4-hydroxy-2-oxoglutarate aldolase/2-dehydro-3-deoxy-phosphogluconate aldolase [Ectothiorhodospiraceae bacterium]|jgi:2-dehydro-3-deoxyphosphogluconate aldolase/(4S)-4-hydroxy-2-oxoglutarate aldolase